MNKPAPLSKNQTEFFVNGLSPDVWFMAAEGGKRGGKNVLGTMLFGAIVDDHPNKLHLAAGVSSTTAQLNILDCDGYGLENYFDGRCRRGKYQDRNCLYVDAKVGTRIILVSGGGKKGDERLIKGNTYGAAYITEANECHSDFIQEVFDRTLSSQNRKILHDFNPKAPKHPYYTDILDFHERQQVANPNYGFLYGHFTIADNYSLSDEKIKKEIATYDKQSVWYKRDILGKRIAAEGIIYRQFADNSEQFYTDNPDYDFIVVGVDFGGNKSYNTFVASGLKKNFGKLTALCSERHVAKDVNPEQLYRQFDLFMERVQSKYGYVASIYADSAEQILINGIKRTYNITRNSIKNEIIDRIRCLQSLIAQGKFFYTEDCQTLVDALCEAQYDDSKLEDVRLDDFTSDIDTLDAFEYSWEKYMRNYVRL